MSDAWTFAALASLMTGCVLPGGGTVHPRPAPQLSLRPVEVAEGWQLELLVGDGQEVTVGHRGRRRRLPTVRHEVLQADGSWVQRRSLWSRYARGFRRPAVVPVASPLVLGGGEHTFRRLEEDPGTFRLAVRARGPSGELFEVTREYTVVGWSEEILHAALSLRARAADAGCREVAGAIYRDLIANLEPDPLLDLYRASPGLRVAILPEMLERGSFTVFLAEHLAAAPMSEIRAAGHWMAEHEDQEPLRPLVAARLSDWLFTDRAALVPRDYWFLSELAEHWPAGVPERVVVRLESGLDEGDARNELLALLAQAAPSFSDLRERVWAALPRHCSGAREDNLLHECERVTAIFDPAQVEIHPDGEARAYSFTMCGLQMYRPHVCRALSREWRALANEAGEPELVWLSGEAFDVPDTSE